MKDAIIEIAESPRVIEKEEFAEIFNRMSLNDADFNTETYLPGSSGARLLYRHFLEQGIKKGDSRQGRLL
jgi:hypothetical protein